MQLDGGPVRRGPRPSPRLYILFYAASVPNTRLPFWYVWFGWRRDPHFISGFMWVKRPRAYKNPLFLILLRCVYIFKLRASSTYYNHQVLKKVLQLLLRNQRGDPYQPSKFSIKANSREIDHWILKLLPNLTTFPSSNYFKMIRGVSSLLSLSTPHCS